MEDILLDTHQSKVLANFQEQFIASLEVIFLSSSALKYLSHTNMLAFFEVSTYYLQRRLTSISKEVDNCYPLMREIGFYGCLKTILILVYVFSEYQQLLPQHSVALLIGALVEYIKYFHIYRSTKNYMMFLLTSIGYLLKVTPSNYANLKNYLANIEHNFQIWLQPSFMPEKVGHAAPYKQPIVQATLADLDVYGEKLKVLMNTPADDSISKHIAAVQRPLNEWFEGEKDLAELHNAVMEGASMSFEDAFNVADRAMLKNWVQQISYNTSR